MGLVQPLCALDVVKERGVLLEVATQSERGLERNRDVHRLLNRHRGIREQRYPTPKQPPERMPRGPSLGSDLQPPCPFLRSALRRPESLRSSSPPRSPFH